MNVHSIPPRPALRRPTALSSVLQAITDEPAFLQCHDRKGGDFRIRVASDAGSRAKAYALACGVYRGCGYVRPDARYLVNAFDALPETFTLLAEDEQGRAAATVTLVFDGVLGMPCDELYAAEAAAVRAPGRRAGEVVRLAIADEYQDAKELFLRMINLAFVYGVHAAGGTDCLIEVSPKHALFYRRFFGFRQLGDRRATPRVCGAPALLLHLDMAEYTGAMDARRAGKTTGFAPIFSRFLAPEREAEAAAWLAEQHRPMSAAEMERFALAPVAVA